jgi:nucleoside-diphosphate-sugar epimerase
MATVLITGGTGFVGSNLVKELVKKGNDVHVVTRSSSDLSSLSDVLESENLKTFIYTSNIDDLIFYFNQIKPDCVYHLASLVIAEHRSSQIDDLVQSNLTFGLHLLEAMKESGTKKIINTGTSWQHYQNEEYNPVCLYAATKQAFEALIEYYVQADGFKVITLKLYDTYGETDTRPKLINLLHQFADEQTQINLTAGGQVLNLCHVSDVVEAFILAANYLPDLPASSHRSYTVAHQEIYQLKEVVTLFETVSDKKLNVVLGGKPYRSREVMTLWNNGENLPGWKATISLETGLKRFI